MNIGIKVGPEDGIEVIKKSRAQFVEVWFRIDQASLYTPLFSYMRKYRIHFGLHFWGMVDNIYFPNLVYYKNNIAEKTAKLIRQTIDIAAQEGAYYVNYHPESFKLVELDLNNQINRLAPFDEVDHKKGFQSLLQHSLNLQSYANRKNVKVIIETVPVSIPKEFKEGKKEEGRKEIVECKGISTLYMEQLGKAGLSLCFDIGHVTGQYPYKSRRELFDHIIQDAIQLAPYTKLIHVTTTIEPFNGTDSHNGILEEDMKKGAFPTLSQLQHIISLFDSQSVLLIPEPQREKMVENYQMLSLL